MTEQCQHKNKVYSRVLLTSRPPKRPWVCQDCGKEGSDKVSYPANQITVQPSPNTPYLPRAGFGPGGLEYPMLERPIDWGKILADQLRRVSI